VLAILAFGLFETFPGWHTETSETDSEHEVKPFPSKPVRQVILGLTGLGALFAFASVFWQHIATAATATSIGALTDGVITTHVGPAIMALGWVSVCILVIVFLGTFIMHRSIQLLDRLTD
jgi:uncharacterized membrane protein